MVWSYASNAFIYLCFLLYNVILFPFRVGIHAGEFESLFLADLEEGQLTTKNISDGIKGQLGHSLIHFP